MSSNVVVFVYGVGAVFALFTAVWAASVVRRDASLVDRFWGLGFVVTGAIWWWAAGAPMTALWLLVPVAIWGLRLSAYITWRNWGHGEDSRYTDMRNGRSDRAFALRSLPMIFWLQAALVVVIGMPIVAVVIAAAEGREPTFALLGVAVSVWMVGFLFEAVGDAQMAAFKNDPDNQGRVMDRGLWHYSRHPNYFGEIVQWIAYGLFATAFGAWWSWASVLLMIVLLLRVSGVTLLEKKLTSSRPGYREYVERTSALIPWPPRQTGSSDR